jgi:hypothetical protein
VTCHLDHRVRPHRRPRTNLGRHPPPHPQLPEVVVVTGTGLSPGAVHLDAKWGHFGADHWVEGHPTEEGQGAALDLSATQRNLSCLSPASA